MNCMSVFPYLLNVLCQPPGYVAVSFAISPTMKCHRTPRMLALRRLNFLLNSSKVSFVKSPSGLLCIATQYYLSSTPTIFVLVSLPLLCPSSSLTAGMMSSRQKRKPLGWHGNCPSAFTTLSQHASAFFCTQKPNLLLH